MALLTDLPADALLRLLNHIVAVSNTGQLLKLAAACRQYLELVAHADWFWQQQSASLGWIRAGVQHPPHAQQPTSISATQPQPPSQQPAAACQLHAAHAASPQQQAGAPHATVAVGVGCNSSRLWFTYYCLRMSCRWRLRLLVRKYIPFLNIQSRLAMQPGASIQELEGVEAALGMKLPWELWELYRFRAGQAPGPGVCFAEACRCLGVHELTVTTMWASNGGTPSLAPDAPVTQQQQLAAVEAQLPALSCGSHGSYGHAAGQHTLGGNTAAAGGGVSASQVVARSPTQDASQQQQLQQQPTGGSSVSIGSDRGATQQGGVASSGESPPEDTCGVLFLSNTMGSVAYVVTSDSAVYLKRGFTHRRIAGNVTAFIQHLLA